jgi:hypothetical protein
VIGGKWWLVPICGTNVDCWSCENYRATAGSGWGEDKVVVARMAFHNHLITLRILNQLWMHAQEDPDTLLRTRVPHFGRTLRAFAGQEVENIPTGAGRGLLEGIE